jgi:hypothetical protein
MSEEFKRNLRLLFEDRAKIWSDYNGTFGPIRMEATREVDIAIALLTGNEQLRIEEALRVKQ